MGTPRNIKPKGGRRYDLARSMASQSERPPAGAPSVRPSVSSPALSDPAAANELRGALETAALVAEPDGTMSFEIAFHDEVFPELACRVSVREGRVVATFLVRDVNQRRLLEAESSRLRAQLEARGLRVTDVRVEAR